MIGLPESTGDDVALLVAVLPEDVRAELSRDPALAGQLNEVVLDLGAIPEIRLSDTTVRLTGLSPVTQDEIDRVVNAIGRFNSDNRAGIERTLHRISGIRNRAGRVIGLTCRVGRAVVGTIETIRDIVESGKNILFLGPPGIGKTTKLRECARVLSMESGRRVIVVDTSNEIAGDGDIPHPGIGYSRRMQVPSPDVQDAVMIEAVENHMPQIIIVDEIGTEAEAQAARTIAERGVQLIATAHGYTLENLIKNPLLSDLVGGVQSVILGDEEAKLFKPVINAVNAIGASRIDGPFAADGFFRGFRADQPGYDAVIAAYHDQGLIPFKLLAGYEAVNVTIGLPFIRTSVSHGTAENIVGQDK
ncbi:AAA family ATPase, partial [bacterium]|nr:AAA family ATPase [bacterium]